MAIDSQSARRARTPSQGRLRVLVLTEEAIGATHEPGCLSAALSHALLDCAVGNGTLGRDTEPRRERPGMRADGRLTFVAGTR